MSEQDNTGIDGIRVIRGADTPDNDRRAEEILDMARLSDQSMEIGVTPDGEVVDPYLNAAPENYDFPHYTDDALSLIASPRRAPERISLEEAVLDEDVLMALAEYTGTANIKPPKDPAKVAIDHATKAFSANVEVDSLVEETGIQFCHKGDQLVTTGAMRFPQAQRLADLLNDVYNVANVAEGKGTETIAVAERSGQHNGFSHVTNLNGFDAQVSVNAKALEPLLQHIEAHIAKYPATEAGQEPRKFKDEVTDVMKAKLEERIVSDNSAPLAL